MRCPTHDPLFTGQEEPFAEAGAEAGFMREFLRPGDVFFDVGAHVGALSLLAVSLGARVVAFEPDPVNAALLRANVPVAVVHEVAVGDSDAHCVYLERWHDHSGDHRVHRIGEAQHQDGVEMVARQMVRLQAFVERERPRLVKVDAQGWEPRVVDGMGGANVPAVIVEHSPYHLSAAGNDPTGTLDGYFARFRVDRLDADLRSPYEITHGGYTNLLLRPRNG